jgi:pimeloyl-ACP methyl ester carboxylesterase
MPELRGRDAELFYEQMQYLPADALGDDALWARLKPSFEADFGERDGALLAAQWQACLDYDSTELLPRIRVPVHAVAFSHDVQTPPARVREVAELAADGHFHLLEGLGHGSAFGHRPDAVNACIWCDAGRSRHSAYTAAQSSLMLSTVQPSAAARWSADSAPVV